MTIAEKITRAKTDYDEVYEAGKQEIVSLHPEKTVSGSFISVNDVSELPHDVKCKISGVANPETVTVTRTGKNMLKPLTKTENSKGITYTVDEHGVITASGTIINTNSAYSYTRVYPVSDYITGEVTVSGLAATEMHIIVIIFIRKSSGTIQYYYLTDENGKTFQCETGDKIEYVELRIDESVGTIVENFVFKPQLEFGKIATEYETYNEQIFTPSADGTVEGMTSVSPYMNIFAATTDANLDVTYRQSKGMQAEYDTFWGVYQEQGRRDNYDYAFSGKGWTKYTFKPKYPIRPTGGYMLFRYFNTGSPAIDLTQYAVLDLSSCKSFSYMFYAAAISRLGVIDVSAETESVNTAFQYSSIETIEKLVVKNDGTTNLDGSFTGCSKLKNLTIEGVIGKTVSFAPCSLTKNSITNIVNVLSPTVTGQTVTFNKAAKEAAFTADEWQVLISTKPNWTISLA